MKKIIHRATERGRGDYGWLTTRYSFSFADWFNPARMGFGKLRVINDDILLPETGFGEHSHRDMEIITIVTKGTVTHKDSMGSIGSVEEGEVQAMSAGTGVRHSEYNNSKTEPLELFQIWIETRARGIKPRYEQHSFKELINKQELLCIVSPDAAEINGSLTIAQDAFVSLMDLESKTYEYPLKESKNGIYIFVINGEIGVEGEMLGKRDAIGISEASTVTLEAINQTKLLMIEVPMH